MEMSAFVYLDELLDNKQPIYVRNVYKTKDGKRGIIVVTLSDNGRTHREAIPNIKHPICLSNKATPNMIRNSSQLRQLLDANALELVPKEQAEQELGRPGVREAIAEAYERIGYKNRDVRALKKTAEDDEVADARLQGKAVASVPEIPEHFLASDSEIEMAEPLSDTNVSARVESICESLASKEIKSRQAKNELEGVELTEADLAYIIANTTGIVQKYAKEKYALLTGESLDEESGDDE
jgi:hypothetical protein